VQTLARKSSSADHSKLTKPIDSALALVGSYLNMLPQTHHASSTSTPDKSDGAMSPPAHEVDGVDDLFAQQQHLRQIQDDVSDLTAGSDTEKEVWFDLLSDEEEERQTRRQQQGFTVHDAKGSPLETIIKQIEAAVASCAPANDRLDLYSEASTYGHIESLYKWSMLLGFGSEIPNTPCGIEEFNPPTGLMYHEVVAPSTHHERWKREYELLSTGQLVSDQVRSGSSSSSSYNTRHKNNC
jgi:hypothetical protein